MFVLSMFMKIDIVFLFCFMGVFIDLIVFCILINCFNKCVCDSCCWLFKLVFIVCEFVLLVDGIFGVFGVFGEMLLMFIVFILFVLDGRFLFSWLRFSLNWNFLR